MFGQRLNAKELAEWCRNLATSLRAGLPMFKALRSSSDRGPVRIRVVNSALLESLHQGEDIGGAIDENAKFFPPLVVSMTHVGVQTGHLPEVLRELEKYYRFQVSLRRLLLQQIAWPIFQLVAAIFVIALVIYLIGMLGGMDILGFGLTGGRGAVIWLGGWGLLASMLSAGYWFARNKLDQAEPIDRLLLRIPVLGNVLRTLAMARVAMALHLTLEAGMTLSKAIPLALAASDNAAVAARAKSVAERVRAGENLSDAFREHAVFPDELLEVLANAEEAGRVPEAMQQLSVELGQRAQHQMGLLNQAAGWLVWLVVAGLLVYLILTIAMRAYIQPMRDMLQAT